VAEGQDERFLSDVRGLVQIAAQPDGGGDRDVLESVDELRPGAGIASLGGADQCRPTVPILDQCHHQIGACPRQSGYRPARDSKVAFQAPAAVHELSTTGTALHDPSRMPLNLRDRLNLRVPPCAGPVGESGTNGAVVLYWALVAGDMRAPSLSVGFGLAVRGSEGAFGRRRHRLGARVERGARRQGNVESRPLAP